MKDIYGLLDIIGKVALSNVRRLNSGVFWEERKIYLWVLKHYRQGSAFNFFKVAYYRKNLSHIYGFLDNIGKVELSNVRRFKSGVFWEEREQFMSSQALSARRDFSIF